MSDETLLDKSERIVEIEMERLRDFRNHPFKIMEDQEMKILMDSIRLYGSQQPDKKKVGLEMSKGTQMKEMAAGRKREKIPEKVESRWDPVS